MVRIVLIVCLAFSCYCLFGQYSIDIAKYDVPARILLDSDEPNQTLSLSNLEPNKLYYLTIISFEGEQVKFHYKGLEKVGLNRYIALAGSASLFPEADWTNGYLSVWNDKETQTETSRMNGIQVSGGQSPDFLIRDVLIGGNCFDVTGVTPIGSGAGRGTFTADSAVIGLEEGIILASGPINNALGPNTVPNAGSPLGAVSSDPDLNMLTVGSIFDAVGLEFDFKPTDEFIKFRYAFASEEYCEFVGTTFNDVFGFFLSGPGISGPFTNQAINLARVPGSADYVAINNVNHNSNSDYFFDNTPINQTQNYNPENCDYSISPAPGITSVLDEEGVSVELLQYDGFTAVFEATLAVQPCELYHIKMVVADVGDGIYDSAVFLEANSFNAGSEVTLEASVIQTGGDEAYEGCHDAYIQIKRLPGSNLSEQLEVLLNINPSSTATNGIDLSEIPSSVTIPAHQESITIPLSIFQDNIDEGIENILIETNFICSCEFPYIELFIRDIPPIEIETEDITLCQNSANNITAIATGGLPGATFTYEWSDGYNIPSRPVYGEETTTLTVTVTDDCDNSGTAEAIVTVIPIPIAELEGDIELCGTTDNVFIPVSLSGDPPFTFSYELNGDQIELITNYNSDEFLIPVEDTGTYSIAFIFGPNFCQGESIGEVEVYFSQKSANPEIGNPLCFGDEDGSVILHPNGFSGSYVIDWEHGSNEDSLFNLTPGAYPYTIEDTTECTFSDTVFIDGVDSMESYFIIQDEPTCGNENGNFFVRVSGGTTPYVYDWEGIDDTTNILNNVGPGIYEVTVTDANGCNSTTSIEILNSFPKVILDSISPVTCLKDGYVSISIQNGTKPFQYFWNGIETDRSDFLTSEGGTIIVSVTDSLGCSAADTVMLPEYNDQPVADAGVDLQFDCDDTVLIIRGEASSLTSTTIIQWSLLQDQLPLFTNTLNPAVQSEGVYVLHLIDTLSGCFSSDTVAISTIEDIPIVSIVVPQPLTCKDSILTLNGSHSSTGPDFNYHWSTSDGNILMSNGLFVDIDEPGTYFLEIENLQTGCKKTSAVTVIEDLVNPVSNAGMDDTLSCDINNLQLDGSGTLNISEVSLLWSNEHNNTIQDPTSIHPTISVPGVYRLTVTDTSNGCKGEDLVEIFKDEDLPLADAGSIQVINCNESIVVLDGSNSESGPMFTYIWSTLNGNILSGNNTLMPVVNQPGEYTLEITNNSNGCRAYSNVEVKIDTISPYVDAGLPMVLDCRDTSLVTLASFDNGAHIIQWTNSQGQQLNSQNEEQILILNPGTYQLTVFDTINGCQSMDMVTVAEDFALPIAEAGPDQQLDCRGNPAALDGSGSSIGSNFIYTWLGETGQHVTDHNNLIAETLHEGTFVLTVSNLENGCASSDRVTIWKNEISGGSLTGDTINCIQSNGQIQISNLIGGTGPFIYTLYPGGQTQTEPLFTQLDAGSYEVFVEDQKGCMWSETVTIETYNPVSVDLIGNTSIEYGESVLLATLLNKPLGEITSITWTDPENIDCDFCPELWYSPDGDVLITVTVLDNGGCLDSAQLQLEVSITPNVYIPNAFSPTSDNINDSWVIYTNQVVTAIDEVMIFNRWGDKVYERTNIPPNDNQFGWNGEVGGKTANEGVYVYWAKLRLIDGSTALYKGEIHLVR